MKTMKKIVAILAVALMLCSILPLSVFAADETATITFDASKSQRTSFSTTQQVWKSGNLTFTNNKASSSNAVADYSNPVRLYQGSEVVIECAGMTQIVIVSDGTAKYKTALQNSLTGAGYTYTNSGNNYTVDLAGVDSVTFSLTAQARFKSITVTYAAASADCDHDSLVCEKTCPGCGTYTKAHAWDNTCDNECNNGCGAENPDYADHVYTNEYDATCNICNESHDITLPATPEAIVEAAYALGKGDTFGVSATLTGIITKIVTAYSEEFSNITVNMSVIDSEGNAIEDKDIQCYRLKGDGADTLTVGNTITVSGIITNFNGTIEFEAGCVLDEILVSCEHDYEYECDKVCALCGIETRPEAACVSGAEYECLDDVCVYCGIEVIGLGHDFDDQWDADCNYGCGYTREVEERPELIEATIDFATKDQRTEYTTSIQVWENGDLKLTNSKGSSTSNVGDYANPARFYKSSSIVIEFPCMIQLVIDCSNTGEAKYSTPWGDMLTAAGLTYTVENKVYTITFAEPTDSISLSCSAQVRANSITASGKTAAEEEEDVAVSFCGFSRSEDVSGLAVRFEIPVTGMGLNDTTAIYDNAYVNGYKLISMGAIASNGTSEKDIPAVYLCDDDVSTSAKFAIRVIKIPEDKKDVQITFTPYVIVEIGGEQVTIYGEAVSSSFNG